MICCQALEALCQHIIDPVIDGFGRDFPSERLRQRFLLTYGFCSVDLKRWLAKKDPVTGKKHGIATPSLDQHMAHEMNRDGRYFCDSRRDRFANRIGAACDFRILDLHSNALVDWILAQGLPFDSLYFYGPNRPIHISYGPQHKRDIWAFTERGTPMRYRPDGS